MDFMTLAANRYSVRKFQSKPIDPSVLEEILHAGHLAPTACNIQPQKILVLNSTESMEKLKQCTKCHFNAPAALIICYDKNECWKRKFDGASAGTVDASIVTTHMMLAAFEKDIGSTWVMYFDPAALQEVFAIPEQYEPVALLVMGYPAPDAEPFAMHSTFRPKEETIFWEHF